MVNHRSQEEDLAEGLAAAELEKDDAAPEATLEGTRPDGEGVAASPLPISPLLGFLADAPAEDSEEADPTPTAAGYSLENPAPQGRNDVDVDYSYEDTQYWTVTNWSGYRNFHCKWPGCQFATVSGKGIDVISKHFEGHMLQQRVSEEARLNGSISSIRRAGLVKPNGERF